MGLEVFCILLLCDKHGAIAHLFIICMYWIVLGVFFRLLQAIEGKNSELKFKRQYSIWTFY